MTQETRKTRSASKNCADRDCCASDSKSRLPQMRNPPCPAPRSPASSPLCSNCLSDTSAKNERWHNHREPANHDDIAYEGAVAAPKPLEPRPHRRLAAARKTATTLRCWPV